ncbi:MAG: aminotransferase class V-fold PLP-dependent enzyme, partial [Rhodanobacteraceae bacterium]
MSVAAKEAARAPVDWAKVRADFPILRRSVHGKLLVYLDSANTAQKPRQVIEAVDTFYREHNANVSRAVHQLSEEATAAYEGARTKLAAFLGANHRDEIVLTSGTTMATNLVAYSYLLPRLKPGDAVVVTAMEHHADIV